MYYEEFKNMHEIHPEGESATERYEIRHVEAKEPDALSKMMNPEYGGQLDQTVCVLRDNDKHEIVMSDSWMEQKTNIDIVKKAEGHVLIGGLGMGMIVLAMQDLERVESITVVEIDQELIDFIVPNLNLSDKVTVVCCDIHLFYPERKYDTIYCDIWNDISGNNLDEMHELTWHLEPHATRGVDHWRYRKTLEEAGESEYEFY